MTGENLAPKGHFLAKAMRAEFSPQSSVYSLQSSSAPSIISLFVLKTHLSPATFIECHFFYVGAPPLTTSPLGSLVLTMRDMRVI